MIRPKNKKNKLKNIKSHMFLTLFLCMGIWFFDTNTVSASIHLEETKIQIIDNAVGRYKLNYTGNTNHFTTWYESGDVNEQKIYDDVGGWANSSSAYLTPQSSSSTIKHAFLVWESRTTEKEGFAPMEAPVYFITPNNTLFTITPQYIIKDNRDNWDGKNHDNYASLCTMATDVTSIVKNAGFGKYSVCNIPMWKPSSASITSEGVYPGGESPGSWQLIIVEESRDFNVRAVSLSVTSEFHLATDFTGRLVLENGLKSTTIDDASGQFLFGVVRSTAGERLVEHISTNDSNGNPIASVIGQNIERAGLFRNGVLQNNRDTANGGACIDLSDISNIGNGATSANLYVENSLLWTSFTILGASFDVSYPDFEGIQTTTVNYDVTEVKVEGSFKNIAVPADTGIYDGNLEIIVDKGLTPISASAKVNGTLITTVPTISGNVVKFSGNEVRNMMNGDDISYTVLCTVNSAGAIKYENEARFNGKLRSEGANTGHWIDQIWVASSKWEREVYRITLDNQGATTAGTPCYFEWYNHGNYTTEGCIGEIDTIDVPTKDNYIFNGYFTGANGTGTKYVDVDGKILSDATTFTSNTTLYAFWMPKIYKITLDNQGAGSGKEGTLCYYEKYGIGNFADKECTVPIQKITMPGKGGYTYAGYWTEKNGGGNICITDAETDPAGAICTRSDQFAQDTTIFADWNPNTYTITCNNQGATTAGSACFYELYNVKFFYDTVVTTSGTAQIPFNYTGGVQYFTAPYTGIYTLDVYGAQGSSAYGTGGYGGRSYGNISLVQGETLYIYVGGAGFGKDGAGWNGGNYGDSFCWNIGAGGGATDIRRNGWALENRVIVAGGGGGGVATPGGRMAPGGNGGGYNYEPYYGFVTNGGPPQDDSTYNGPVLNPRANLAAQTAGQASGKGGGGGYYGGRTVPTIYLDGNNTIPAGEGGTGYVGGVSNGSSVAGVRSGNGYAVITRSNYTTRRYDTTKIDVPTKQGYYFRGYFTGTNGSGTAITDAKGKILVDPDYFTANATVYAYWSAIPEQNYTIVYDGNGATGGSMASVSVPVDVNYRLNTNLYARENYTFAGWSTSPAGGVAYQNNATVRNLTTPGKTITLYAVWKANTYTIRFHGNGETGGSMEDMHCDYGKDYRLTQNTFEKAGYHFVKWTTNQDGTGDGYADGQTVNSLKANAQGIVHLYAQWEANSYTIVFDPNGGGAVTSIDGITVKYDEQLTLPDASGSYIKYTLDGINVTQQVLDGDIVLDAAGVVVLMLDEESGEMVTPGSAAGTENTDGNAAQETEKTETDGTDKINAATDSTETDGTEAEETAEESGTEAEETHQENPEASTTEAVGENPEVSETEADTPETASVVSKEVSRTATAAEETQPAEVLEAAEVAGQSEAEAAEQTEEADEPQPDKKAYASVYMGWSLADGKEDFQPQWKAGEAMDASTVIDTAGVTNQDGAVITLYAVWDDCPWIQAVNLYYTLEQAQNGFITQDEILSHATALDREDGSPILPGIHDNGTSFTIPDYAATDFTQFQHEGSCTENLTVVDSVGSMYAKQITVYIVDTTPVAVLPEGTTRFINEKYYNEAYENGGLEDNSIWKTDPEYVAALQTAFDNLNNDTPVQTYYFTRDVVLQMQDYVDAHGVGNTREPDALQNFYDQFMAPNLQ